MTCLLLINISFKLAPDATETETRSKLALTHHLDNVVGKIYLSCFPILVTFLAFVNDFTSNAVHVIAAVTEELDNVTLENAPSLTVRGLAVITLRGLSFRFS